MRAEHRRGIAGWARATLAGSALTLVAGATFGIAAPALATAPHSQLHAVTCVKSSSCIAVGEYQSGAGQGRTLIERWNGKKWSIVASPNAAGANFSRLYAVACTSASSCFAVGQHFTRTDPAPEPLIERWNGTAWSIVPGARPKIGGELRGIACASATFCIATGGQNVSTTQCCKTFVERWNGKIWSAVTTPTPAQSNYSRLNAVTCTSASKCFAVGTFAVNGTSFTLVERMSGAAWSILASPNPEIGDGGYFNAVACTSATNCFAAGAYNEGGPGRPGTLIERWNGSKWSIVANAIPPRAYTELNGVACANPSACFTVGDWNRFSLRPPLGFTGSRTLIQRWNGKSWSLATSPKNVVAYNSLEGVACSSPTDCFAVGRAEPDTTGVGGTVLVQHWNGTAWSATPAPSR